MPPQCCRCNGNGRCRGCVCAKKKQACTNCTPGRNSRCENRHIQPTSQALTSVTPVTAESEPTLELSNSVHDTQETAELDDISSSMAGNAPDVHYQTNLDTQHLPSFVSLQPPTIRWGEVEGEVSVCDIQEEIVHWKRNLFKVPSGRAGKSFIRERTRMFRAYTDVSALEMWH